MQLILQYRLDAIIFDLLLLLGAISTHIWLRRRHRMRMPRPYGIAVILLLFLGPIAAEIAGEHERGRLRDMLSGFAPTYAQEMELLGHSKLTFDTPPDDPRYLAMIQAQIRWLNVNTYHVSDIYTLRKRADGKLAFVVDSETDYNHNGIYDDDREQRTPIGEVYDEVTDNMLRAFNGVATFDDIPVTDRWGTWVSAYAPLHDADGKVEGILGVDYDAKDWLTAIAWNRATAFGFVAIVAIVLHASTVIVMITRAELVRRAADQIEREKLQEQLMVASRQAGMAEVATNVLHNVGNVLNSVNVSTGLLSEKLLKSKLPGLVKATQMMHDNRATIDVFLTTDSRGRLLADYLPQVADLLSQEQKSMLGELTLLARSVDHIKQIVASQQTFAHGTDVMETFQLPQLLEDAIRINLPSMERHEIALIRQFGDIGAITADRHKILQILINLISNAKNAVATNEGSKQITIELEKGDDESHRPVTRIIVTDNGSGIKSEALARIFTHGFTTRQEGHGFGLHYSAIAAQQMKGKLTVESRGAGQGARFTLELPHTSLEVAPS